MVDLRPVGYIVGLVILALGVAMLVPMTVDFALANGNGPAFAQSAIVTIALGGFTALACHSRSGAGTSVRQAFLLTLATWMAVPLAGSLPFMAGAPGVRFVDAYFEAVSGITTTGATVFTGLDGLPAGMNLWRGILNWIGGLGITFVAMIFLPVMRVGGMQFFRTEGFETLGKVLPRATDIARSLVIVYIGLTLLFVGVYAALGMERLDAVMHGLTTVSAGGLSPSDRSFAKYPGAAEYAGGLFIILATMPYVRYVQLVNGQPRPLWRDEQARAYLRWISYAVGTVTLWRWLTSDQALESVFREAFFNIVSIFSGTGFASGSFAGWGGYALVVAVIVGIIGGCTSSSSAALSVFQVQITLRAIAAEIRRVHSPNRIAPVRYDGRRVDDDVLNSVIMYVYSFIFLLGGLSVLLTLLGLDFESAFFAAWASITNVGYGFGPIVARTGTFVEFPDGAKWVMIAGMLIGRLALMAFFVILVPRFWRA